MNRPLILTALLCTAFPAAAKPAGSWKESVFGSDPAGALLRRFTGKGAVDFTPTGLKRADYLKLISGEVDFWKKHQNADGAIIDPYRKKETQYSTPAFALAAGLLAARANRADLLEPAAKAMDWATLSLHNRAAADRHEDFYTPMLANALTLLGPLVAPARLAAWENHLRFDPKAVYRNAPGQFNWNIVSSAGEALLQLRGIRPRTNNYVTESWGAQGRHFTSPHGLYEEGPMPYDLFPRIWLEDALAQGYSGPFTPEIRRALDRAAVTSLFMQSPWGELPAGGRSAQHQWNEAEECLTFEIHAGKAKAAGNPALAGAYKRAARLALSSMFRWQRPGGDLQIVKNRVDPAQRHGYEGYSFHSQYNLLAAAMLALAYEHAAASDDVAECPAPADTGGFVFQLDGLHKIFANAGGSYVEIDTAGDPHYDATGLIRVHRKGVPPQLGPSDSLLSKASYKSPAPVPMTTGTGVSWQNKDGQWITLGSLGRREISSATLKPGRQAPDRVDFDVTYSGKLPNAKSVTEHYVITPGGVQLTTRVDGYSGPLRYVWPVLSNDGKTASDIRVRDKTLTVSQDGASQKFTAPGAGSVTIGDQAYSNHNGWARLATADFPIGGAITLLFSLDAPVAGGRN